ncbi:MAG: GDSL-type esterase/lipase family protein, partial [PVC group bacterium]
MKPKKMFLAAVVLIFPVLLHPFTSAPAEEMWLVWSDYNQNGNPVLISQLRQDDWHTENFPPGQTFDANFAPSPGLDKAGNLWVVWAACRDNAVPAVYWSRQQGDSWGAPRRVDGESARWECTPAIAFDRGGNPIVAWSAVAGASTEIFCSGWSGDGFGPAVMVSAPDDAPDGRPSLAIGDDGNPDVFWEGWQDGHAQIFLSRLESGTWSPEETADPRPGVDQILPAARGGAASWMEDGTAVEFEGGKRRAGRGIAGGVPGAGLPDCGSGAWLLLKNPAGDPAAYRYRTLLPPRARTGSGPTGRALATYYYIGYGDDITCSRSYGPDIGNWYGTHLSSMLPTIFPGQTFVLYNEGYPLSITSDLLSGGGACPGINAVIDSRPLAGKILIMGGTNDVGWGVALSDTAYYLGQMIDRARAKGVEPILGTIIPRVDAIENYNRSTDLSTNYIPPLATEKNCALADPWQVYMAYWDTDYFWGDLYGYPYYWDGINPNGAEGNQEIANAWYAAFSNPTPSPTPATLILDSGDYDGDSTSDIAVFRKSSGLWAVKGVTRVYFGTGSDTPASGDFDGDGRTDLAL